MTNRLLAHRSIGTATLAFVLLTSSCSSSIDAEANSVPEPANTTQSDPAPLSDASDCDDLSATIGTNLRSSGNRLFDGSVDLAVPPMDVELEAEPLWVLSFDPPGSWYVVLVDGSAVIISADGTVSPTDAPPPGEPPQLRRTDDALLVESSYVLHSLFDDPLPDTRVVTDGPFAAALVEPTDRYQHGIAGDLIEAAAVEVLDRCTGERTRIEIPAPSVIEGISPMLADLDGDGMVDVIVTTSNGDVGARLEAYRVDGSLLGTSEPIGLGGRWRNQLGVAPLGPGGIPELIDVRVPHINGVVEFFQLQGDELVVVADITGFTSHVIGSRNLDMGVLADADGDGRPEVILYDQDRNQLVALERTVEGVDVLTQVGLGGTGVTNIAVQDVGPGAALAVGTSSGTLRIWTR